MWIFKNGGNRVSEKKPGEVVIKENFKSNSENNVDFNNKHHSDVDSDIKNSSSDDIESSNYYRGSLTGECATGSYDGKSPFTDRLNTDNLKKLKKKNKKLKKTP